MIMFNPNDWYWTVGPDTSRVYSSKRNIYVATNDAAYMTWLGICPQPIPANTEEDIWLAVKDVKPWWLWTGTVLSQPAAGQYHKDQLQNYNIQVRLDKVTGGMVAAGVPVRTDDRSQGLMNTARAAADNDPNFTTKWYGTDGSFYTVDATQMIEMHNAVGQHTNDCFAVFEQTASAITLNTVTTIEQIDTAYSGL